MSDKEFYWGKVYRAENIFLMRFSARGTFRIELFCFVVGRD